MSISPNLAALMQRRGLTQEALAEALGVSHRSVGGWLGGAQPRPAMVRKLADFFAVPVEVFGSEDAPLPPDPDLVAREPLATFGPGFESHLQRLRMAASVGRELFPENEVAAAQVLDALFEALVRIERRLEGLEDKCGAIRRLQDPPRYEPRRRTP